MKFLLSLVVFSQVGVLVRELVEVLDEVVQNLLLSVETVQEVEESLLCIGILLELLLAVKSDVSENCLHLVPVVQTQVFPHLHDNWLEITVNVISFRENRWCMKACHCTRGVSKLRLRFKGGL